MQIVVLLIIGCLLSTPVIAGAEKVTKEDLGEVETQKVIDPQTGRDLTGEYVAQKLKELEETADEIIRDAFEEYVDNPQAKIKVYKAAIADLQELLDSGSIGPATGAAVPLIEIKKKELADKFEVNQEDRL
ncbi:MAG: hypothetical protein KKA19_05870 [Candidatus Margulisbacteria bacterium]|nr:hypothetical protein [Candidatus Margulisiibacteriota bacterium]